MSTRWACRVSSRTPTVTRCGFVRGPRPIVPPIASATRFRPILLTALAAMIGAATILTDPIFQGLAISLLFGLASSTLLTVLVIPAIYVWLKDADSPVGRARDR